jgi:hypothetical protein
MIRRSSVVAIRRLAEMTRDIPGIKAVREVHLSAVQAASARVAACPPPAIWRYIGPPSRPPKPIAPVGSTRATPVAGRRAQSRF